LAQAHWHGFRYRFGEMVGLDRAAELVRLAAMFDDEARQITPPRCVRYDTLVIAIGSVTNDFGAPGVAERACGKRPYPYCTWRARRRFVETYWTPGEAALIGGNSRMLNGFPRISRANRT
jgi:NADH dehydrogenase FAD-containing subunit